MLLLFALLAIQAPAQLALNFSRLPQSVTRVLVAPGKAPGGLAVWQVAAINEGSAPVQVDHAAVLAAAARCTAVMDPALALSIAKRAHDNSRSRRAWRAVGIGADVAATVVPTAQIAGVIDAGRAAPYLSFGLLAVDVVARLARAESVPMEHPAGAWLRPGEASLLDPGRGALWLFVGGQSPARFSRVLGGAALVPSFEVETHDSWGCR